MEGFLYNPKLEKRTKAATLIEKIATIHTFLE